MSRKLMAGNKKGMALAMVIVIFAVVSVLCLSVLSSAASESNQTFRNEKYNEAYYLADSAARLAVQSINSRINLYSLAFNQYDAEPDGSSKDALKAALLNAHTGLNKDIVPGAGESRSMIVEIGTASYPVTITRRPANPSAPSGPFHLVVSAQAQSSPLGSGAPVTAQSVVKMGEMEIVTKLFKSNLGDGIQTTGDLFIEQNGVLKANIHAGGSIGIGKTKVVGIVTAVGNISQLHNNGQIDGDAIAGGSIIPYPTGGAVQFVTGTQKEGASVPVDDYYVNADIITPEMVWLRKSVGILPIPPKGPASALPAAPSVITTAHSGYYSGGSVQPGNYTVDLKDGSVVLVFDKYYVPNSNQPVFTVRNSDPAYDSNSKHNFYLIIKQPYVYPDDLPVIDVKDLFHVDANEDDLFLNHPTIGNDVRTYLIVLNAGSQRYIYENFVDPISTDPEDLAELFTIEGGKEILRNPAAYSDYYNSIAFNNGAELFAHIIAPLCELTFKNNNKIAGTIRASKVSAQNNLDFNIQPIDVDLGAGTTPFPLYLYSHENTWIKP